MTFTEPLYLLLLLLVPVALGAYVLVGRRRSRYAVRFTNVDLLANLVPHRPRWRRHVPTVLYIGAIAALAFALARPSMVVAVPREEATVMLAIDVSRSMDATDVSPTRLDAAKSAAADFVDQLPKTFEVGLVAFSTEARVVVHPTTDRAQLHDAIDDLQADGGTALGDAIALSIEASGAQAKPASAPLPAASGDPAGAPLPSASADPAGTEGAAPIVATVLLSDGANSTGSLEPLDAARQAVAAGVPVYTIALGTQDGVVDVPDPQGGVQSVQVPPDTATLETISSMTGAKSFQAPTAEDLAQIYEHLGSKVGFTQEEREVTQWFAAGALLLVLSGAGLAAVWFNRFP